MTNKTEKQQDNNNNKYDSGPTQWSFFGHSILDVFFESEIDSQVDTAVRAMLSEIRLPSTGTFPEVLSRWEVMKGLLQHMLQWMSLP